MTKKTLQAMISQLLSCHVNAAEGIEGICNGGLKPLSQQLEDKRREGDDVVESSSCTWHGMATEHTV